MNLMKNNNASEKAYSELRKFVNRTTRSTFDTNTLRERLSAVQGFKKTQLSGVINKAINARLIYRVGTTTSKLPNHNSGKVGVYTRWS
jgi:hypothetical protein